MREITRGRFGPPRAADPMRPAALASPDVRRLGRFALVGVANTAVGYSVILAGLALGLGDIASNVAGYCVGLSLSFVLNSRWTFADSRGVAGGAPLRFLASFAVAYGVNLAVVLAGRAVGLVEQPLVHLVAMAVYSAVFYLEMNHFVFVDGTRTGLLPRVGLRRLMRERWPELLLFAAFVAGFVLLWGIPVSHDVVWQMWVAQQMLHGARLYVDILEVNPPLWFWMALPVQQLANATGIASPHLMAAAVYVYGGLSLALLALLSAELRPRDRAILFAAFVATTALSLYTFAQREHIALIAAVVYAMLIARRRERAKVAWPLALAVGLLSGPGFALKHYFIIVPAALEIWLFVSDRSLKRRWRPETVTLAALAAAYALAVVVLAPGFLATVVPMLVLAYDGYHFPLIEQLTSPSVLVWLLAAIGLWLARQAARPPVAAFAIAGLAFAASYFIQGKGWSYQALPATGCLFIAVAGVALRTHWKAFAWNPFLAAALVLPLAMAMRGPYENPLAPHMASRLRDVPKGSVVYMAAVNPSRIWPMVAVEGYRWPSRYYSLWMLPTIANDQAAHGALSPRLQRLADGVRAGLLHDLSCNPPRLMLVDGPDPIPALKEASFDYLRFLRQDDGLADFLSHYTHTSDHGVFDIFRKPDDWSPARPVDCRDIFPLNGGTLPSGAPGS